MVTFEFSERYSQGRRVRVEGQSQAGEDWSGVMKGCATYMCLECVVLESEILG